MVGSPSASTVEREVRMKKSPEAVLEVDIEGRGLLAPMTVVLDDSVADENDPRRVALREWLDLHPSPTGPDLARAGLVAPHLPRPWGLDADVD